MRHRRARLLVLLGAAVALSTGVGLSLAGAALPPGPSNLRATARGSYVELRWTTGSETTDVVERSTSATAGFAGIGRARRVRKAGAKAYVRDTHVDAGTVYYYRISGTTTGGTVRSNVVSVRAGAPAVSTTSTTTAPVTGGQPQWWKDLGAQYSDAGTGITVDGAGESTFSASITGKVDFGTGPVGVDNVVTSAVVHNAVSGSARWARDLRASVVGVAADARNNDVLAAGTFGGSVDFGTGTRTAHSSGDLFVARYTKTNAAVWARNFGSDNGWAIPNAVAVDPSGNVVVTGFFFGSIDLGTGLLRATGSGRAVFLASYGPAGTPNWTKAFSPSVDGGGVTVATDAQGNVGVSGFFKGALDLGGSRFQSANGSEDIFVAQYSSAGAHRWSKRFGDTADDRGTAVGFQPNAALVVAGHFGGTIDFGGGPLTNPKVNTPYGVYAERDIFLAQFTALGAHQWSKHFVPPVPDGFNGGTAQSLAVDTGGNVVLAGSVILPVDFGGGPLAGSTKTVDVFVAKFTASGAHRWSHRWGAAQVDRASSVAVTPTGDVLATGVFAQQVGPLTTRGLEDGFVVRLSP